jgi:hypothetical protein
LDGDFLYLSLGHLVKEIAEADLSGWSLGPTKHIEEGDHDQSNNQPERQILIKLAHRDPP